MTDQIDLATASQLFDTEVTLKYQNKQYLQNTINERHGTTGETTNVPVSDEIEMQQSSFAPTNIPVTNVNETNVTITPYDYKLKTVIGGGEKTLFAYNKIVDHARLHAKAAARMTDYIKINALFSYSGLGSIYTVDVDVGYNTGLNAQKMTEALSYLSDQGVDVDNKECSMWTTALSKTSFFDDDKVVNFFYNDRKPLVDNRISEYLDVDIRFLGSNGINTIPFTTAMTTDTYLVPIISKNSMLQTFNRDVTTKIWFNEGEDRTELITVMTSGAGVIQSNGIALLTVNNPSVANA